MCPDSGEKGFVVAAALLAVAVAACAGEKPSSVADNGDAAVNTTATTPPHTGMDWGDLDIGFATEATLDGAGTGSADADGGQPSSPADGRPPRPDLAPPVPRPDGWKPPIPPIPDGGTGDYGSICLTAGDPGCIAGFTCAAFGNGPIGYCTTTCGNLGQPCADTPEGTFARCIPSDSSAAGLCIFSCELKDEDGQTRSFTCPGQLECSPIETPRGSGTHACLHLPF
jgi:hypothetical protein